MKKTMIIAVVSAFVGGFATQAFADKQPLMKKAVVELEAARRTLENATADKGGHRAAAIGHVDAALLEVKAGIEFDNKH